MSYQTQSFKQDALYAPIPQSKPVSLCDGKIYVREHKRNGSPVRAYTRLCPVHKYGTPYNEKLNLTGVHGPIIPMYKAMMIIADDVLTPVADEIITLANNGSADEKFLDVLETDLYSLIEYLILMVPSFEGWQIPLTREDPMLPDEVAARTASLAESCVNDMIAQEGKYIYVYADTKCNPTIGVGHLVATEKEFVKLPLYRKKADGTYEPLSVYEKQALFREIQSIIADNYTKIRDNGTFCELVCNTRAEDQTLLSNLKIVMKEEDIRAMAKQDLKKAIKGIRDKVAAHGIEFFDLPPSLQQALTDMQFNMGGRFVLSEKPRTATRKSWPKATHMLRQGALLGMALNIDSSDVGDRRNIYRKALLARAQIEYWRYMLTGSYR